MRARIFKQPRSTMQSGVTHTDEWVLEWAPTERRAPDPMMGWWGSGDVQTQVKLRFPSRDEAIAYAQKVGAAYDVEVTPPRVHRPKVYADNFRYDRLENWTH